MDAVVLGDADQAGAEHQGQQVHLPETPGGDGDARGHAHHQRNSHQQDRPQAPERQPDQQQHGGQRAQADGGDFPAGLRRRGFGMQRNAGLQALQRLAGGGFGRGMGAVERRLQMAFAVEREGRTDMFETLHDPEPVRFFDGQQAVPGHRPLPRPRLPPAEFQAQWIGGPARRRARREQACQRLPAQRCRIGVRQPLPLLAGQQSALVRRIGRHRRVRGAVVGQRCQARVLAQAGIEGLGAAPQRRPVGVAQQHDQLAGAAFGQAGIGLRQAQVFVRAGQQCQHVAVEPALAPEASLLPGQGANGDQPGQGQPGPGARTAGFSQNAPPRQDSAAPVRSTARAG